MKASQLKRVLRRSSTLLQKTKSEQNATPLLNESEESLTNEEAEDSEANLEGDQDLGNSLTASTAERCVWYYNNKLNDWILGEWTRNDIANNLMTFQLGEDLIEVKSSDTCDFDPSHRLDLDNLTLMNNLHEAPLLDMLRRRWFGSKIYTYSGDILISINPYKVIRGIYDNPDQFFSVNTNAGSRDGQIDTSSESSVAIPHVYHIANIALRVLTQKQELLFGSTRADNSESSRVGVTSPTTEKLNQSIIISGESGAGKLTYEMRSCHNSFLII